jgi:CubicO group peptidase (beta-lactamase class C family)
MTPPVIRAGLAASLFVFILVSAVDARDRWPAKRWPTATPASVGLDRAPLEELDAEIARGEFGHVNSMLVIRRGKLVFARTYRHDYESMANKSGTEADALRLHDRGGSNNYLNPWWHPYYRRGALHTMQSVTKTVMSATIGVAIARNEFHDPDTPILEFFPGVSVANLDERKRRVTIRHLLTMTAGIEWSEDLPFSDPKNSAHAMERGYDWVRYTMDQPMQHEPGTVFHYSSGASQVLSHIFQQATGHDLEEYAAKHLFTPLGIEEFFWKRTPTGLVNTEGGLYLRPEDLAKIGYLFLRNGVWDGRQIVDAGWVKASVAPAADVPESPGVKYGYQWWLFEYGGDSRLAWAAAGWGGQILIAVPEHDLVLVFTGWNILDETPKLRHRIALERVLRAVRK